MWMSWFRFAEFPRRVAIPLIGSMLVSGCGFFGERETQLDNYVTELATEFDTPAELSPIPTVESLPRRRYRRMAMPDVNLGLVDFLSLYGCELQVVMGERTSILGRVMDPGTRLEYEIRFLAAAHDCIPDIESERRAEKVADAAWTKEEHLSAALWNGIWGVEEMETLLSRSRGTLPDSRVDDAFDDLARHLDGLIQMLETLEPGVLPVELDALKDNHRLWRSRALVGQLLRSAEAVHTRLDDAAHLVEQLGAQDPACERIEGAPEALYRELFLEQAWPRVARVQQYQRQIIPRLNRLLEAPGADIPQAMEAFVSRNLDVRSQDSVWHDLDEALARHGRAWTGLISACSLAQE